MTEALGFALIAVLAFGGWALTLAMVSRAFIPQANTAKILQAIVDREDAKVHSLAKRALELRHGVAPTTAEKVPPPAGSGPMADVFRSGSVSTEVIREQPDASDDVEIME